MGADGEDVVLVVRAVRERHLNCAAGVHILITPVADRELHTGNFRVVRVQTGKLYVIAKLAVIQLRQQHALADFFFRCADHTACL